MILLGFIFLLSEYIWFWSYCSPLDLLLLSDLSILHWWDIAVMLSDLVPMKLKSMFQSSNKVTWYSWYFKLLKTFWRMFVVMTDWTCLTWIDFYQIKFGDFLKYSTDSVASLFTVHTNLIEQFIIYKHIKYTINTYTFIEQLNDMIWILLISTLSMWLINTIQSNIKLVH